MHRGMHLKRPSAVFFRFRVCLRRGWDERERGIRGGEGGRGMITEGAWVGWGCNAFRGIIARCQNPGFSALDISIIPTRLWCNRRSLSSLWNVVPVFCKRLTDFKIPHMTFLERIVDGFIFSCTSIVFEILVVNWIMNVICNCRFVDKFERKWNKITDWALGWRKKTNLNQSLKVAKEKRVWYLFLFSFCHG